MSIYEQDHHDLNALYEILENEILPAYYDHPEQWRKIQYNSMDDVKDQFNSDRMADEYYEALYNYKG
jgi:starch phosphorylase